MNKPITIVGAGFTGLTLAYYLNRCGLKVKVCESTSQVGGLLQSPKTEYGVIDYAANGLINSQSLLDLAQDIGLDVLYPGENSKKKYLYVKGKKTRWPLSFVESTKLIFKLFKFKKNKFDFKPGKKETLRQWVSSTFSEPALNSLVEPAFQGVYASRSDGLSAKLVTKNFFSKSKKSTSKVRRQTVSFKGGMQEFCVKLSSFLEASGVEIKLNSEVKLLSSDEVSIITTGPQSAAQIIKGVNPKLSSDLSKIKMISIAKVACFIDKNLLSPQGFGCLFAKNEGFNSLGVLFDSAIFPSRYNDYSLQTWILGDKKLSTIQTDEEILSLVTSDIKKLWGKEVPIKYSDVKLWKKTLPCYDFILEDFLDKHDVSQKFDNLYYLYGNYCGDLGLSQILEKSKKFAQRIYDEQTR